MYPARVVVVEDEGLLALDIEKYLNRLDYKVVGTASSGEEATTLVDNLKPDVVLMDIMLRGPMNGIDAAQQIRQHSNAAVVFLTAYSDEQTLQRAIDIEPHGYILKPFEEADLKVAVELALKKTHLVNGQQNGAQKTIMSAPASILPWSNEAEALFPLLQEIELIKQLPNNELRRLAAGATLVSVPSKHFICTEGEERKFGLLVTKGRLALSKVSLNGRQLIVEMLGPRDPLGLLMALEEGPFTVNIRAEIQAEILKVPKEIVSEIFQNCPGLYKEFVHQFSERVRCSQDFSRALAHDCVDVRIASALCYLAPKFAQCNESNQLVIKMTRQELADFTGTTPETAIRVTRAMERQGLLDLARPGAIGIINLETLTKLAEC